MSVDDQLFKEDGTLLTKVDILILKFARAIAAFMFADPDDETFDNALQRMLRLAGLIALTAGITKGAARDWFGLAAFGVVGILLLMFAWSAACNGRGSTVNRSNKALSLGFLAVPIVFGLSTYWEHLATKTVLELNDIGYLIWCLSLAIQYLSTQYVARLGQKPPKRKKAKALKPALNGST